MATKRNRNRIIKNVILDDEDREEFYRKLDKYSWVVTMLMFLFIAFAIVFVALRYNEILVFGMTRNQPVVEVGELHEPHETEVVIVQPKTVEVKKEWHEIPKFAFEVTDEELNLMARVVMSEASILSLEGKQLVATTIVLRMLSPDFKNTLQEVIDEGCYSTQDNGDPNEDCYTAVRAALTYPYAFGDNLFYFRTGHPHEFADFYTQVGNTYFSKGK